ncbi:MAG: hypothetical protein ACRCUJ_06575 [Phocaeicola sp.]
MPRTKIERYITKRYDRWLDYSTYHCGLQQMPDEAVDVLNEVLMSLWQKPITELMALYEKKKGEYREFDFYILRAIKLNITSPTSPYGSKYKPMPVDSNADYSRIEILDEDNSDEDTPGAVLDKFNQVREAFDDLALAPFAKRIFEYKFFQDGSFADWEGKEGTKELYEVYNGVVELIRNRLNGNSLF